LSISFCGSLLFRIDLSTRTSMGKNHTPLELLWEAQNTASLD
jgi:hypothetical protein